MKEDAALIEIREEDGAQCYRFGPGLNDIVWLSGRHRAQNVKLGDKGDLVYSADRTEGRWTFLAYDKSTPTMGKGIRVTVDDLEKGTKEVKEITDDYIIICTGRHYVSGTTVHSNGTHVIVVKRGADDGGD